MFSKPLKTTLGIALLISFVTLGGCSLPTNEDPPATPDVNAGFGSECLSGAIQTMKVFVQGDAPPAKIEAFWNCMSTTVADFEKNTHGYYEDRFTARALANFVERYFLTPGQKIPDGLLTEIFRLKQLFVGGSVDYISRDEMFKLIKTMSELKKITLDLNPYMKIYMLNWKVGTLGDPQKDVQFFELGNLQIQQSAKDLASVIEKNGQSYNVDNIVHFAEEMEKFAGEQWNWIDTLNKAMPLVHDLKKTLTGGSENIVEPKEWIRFSLIGSRGYIQYLRYNYFMANQTSIGNGPALIYITRSVDDLFSFLGDMVEGKPQKTLTRQELFKICESLGNFLPGFKISDTLIKEAMKIKVVFFGGGIDFFEKADFDRARAKLDAFRTLTEQAIAYIDVYGFSWEKDLLSPKDAAQYFRDAESTLADAGKSLGENMENRYDLADLYTLAAEVDKLYPDPTPDKETLTTMLQKYLPAVIAYKNILFYDSGSVVGGNKKVPGKTPAKIASQEWSDLLFYGAQLFSKVAYFHYFLGGQDILEFPTTNKLRNLVNDSLALADSLIDRRQDETIHFGEFHNLWLAVSKAKLLPGKVTVKTLDSLTVVLFQKLLLPPDMRISGVLPDGMTKLATKEIKSEFRYWYENQVWMSDFYQDVDFNVGKFAADITAALKVAKDPFALKELKMIYESKLPLALDKNERVFMAQKQIKFTKHSTDVVNITRSIVRLVIRGYAEDPARIETYKGITEAEANSLYADVKPLFVELQFLDPKDNNFAIDRFRDANLFTPESNGDEFLDYKEASALVMMLYSGINIDGALNKELIKTCSKEDAPSGFAGEATFDVACVTRVYKMQLPMRLANLPHFLYFMSTMDAATADTFILNLLKASGFKPDATGRIKAGNLSLFPQISQYVESVFLRADTDRDQFIWTQEALDIYPVFAKIITMFSGQKSDKLNRAAFTYMLKKGKPPETLSEKISFILTWAYDDPKNWKIWADRQMVVKILGYIADAMSQSQTMDLEEAKIEAQKRGRYID